MTENSILIGISTFNIFALQGKSPIGNIWEFVLTLLNIWWIAEYRKGFFPFFNESKWLNNKIEKENYFLIMIFTFIIQKIIKKY